MKHNKFGLKSFGLILFSFFLSFHLVVPSVVFAQSPNGSGEQTEEKKPADNGNNNDETGQSQQAEEADSCPLPDAQPHVILLDAGEPGDPLVDPDQDVKDIGTKFIVNNFFTSKTSLFNFMQLVYGNLDKALAEYREKNGLKPEELFLVFKGGNVLRMVANEVFDLLTPQARGFLTKRYAEYFTRSDNDFSVYVDPRAEALKDNYEKSFGEITTLVFNELNNIREEFKRNPEKYFDFFKLNSSAASEKMKDALKQLSESDAVKDKTNHRWYQADFKQFQLLDYRANTSPDCIFFGNYDFQTVPEGDMLARTRLTEKPDWIVNTDNRTIQFPWGSDSNKLIKFYLVRLKVAFDIIYDLLGKTKRKTVLGELIDVSLLHKDSSDTEEENFFEHYKDNISTYTLIAENEKDQIDIKAYSPSYLAKDLKFILFDSFIRPWEGGPKYKKRLYRLFFLHIAELLKQYGLGSKELINYVAEVKENIVEPLNNIDLASAEATDIAKNIKEATKKLKDGHQNLPITIPFWERLANLLQDRLIPAPINGDKKGFDKKGFDEFLKFIKENLENIEKLGKMQKLEVPTEEIFSVEIDNLL
jgi:hypothetical protein